MTSGSNGTCAPAYLCTAGAGWDGPTGLGTPNGTGGLLTRRGAPAGAADRLAPAAALPVARSCGPARPATDVRPNWLRLWSSLRGRDQPRWTIPPLGRAAGQPIVSGGIVSGPSGSARAWAAVPESGPQPDHQSTAPAAAGSSLDVGRRRRRISGTCGKGRTRRVVGQAGPLAGELRRAAQAAELVDQPAVAGVRAGPDPAAGDLVHALARPGPRPAATFAAKSS